MGAKDIEEHQFKKGKSGNPNGRPKKSFASINDELKKEGFKALKKSEIIEAYGIIFNTTEERLKQIAGDKDAPFGLRKTILYLNDKKNYMKAYQDYRDYMFGRAKENIDHTTKGESINVISLGSGVKPEE